MLTKDELERYDRQIMIPGIGEEGILAGISSGAATLGSFRGSQKTRKRR